MKVKIPTLKSRLPRQQTDGDEPRRAESGITLVEVLVALAILAGATVGFMTVFSAVINRSGQMDEAAQAFFDYSNALVTWPLWVDGETADAGPISAEVKELKRNKRTCMRMVRIDMHHAPSGQEQAFVAIVPRSVRHAC